MSVTDSVSILELTTFQWPDALRLPLSRFRLFVAADAKQVNADTLSRFGRAALESGMVYFCAWGPGCERFHDIVDETILEDGIGARRFVGPNDQDTIMTTWLDEALEEALEFFKDWTLPTEGFLADSERWVVLVVDHPEWASTARRWFANC